MSVKLETYAKGRREFFSCAIKSQFPVPFASTCYNQSLPYFHSVHYLLTTPTTHNLPKMYKGSVTPVLNTMESKGM